MRPQCVCIVDADRDTRTICRLLLEFSGYEVLEAADGEVGLQLIRSSGPALVISELTVPKLDGEYLARSIQQDPATRGIQMIAMTAQSFAEDRRRALAAGFGECLVKPVEPRVLLRVVQASIGGPGTGSSPEERVEVR